ncbi:MAG: YsnF/AvaK domain-containing protein [Chitinophagaceae bacterium]
MITNAMDSSINIPEQNHKMLSDDFIKVPVIEEKLHVEKRIVESGKVHISKTVNEHQEQINIPLNHEQINIERIAINKYIEIMPDAVKYEGETMIIPVIREVIEKRILLVEEIRVTKQVIQTQQNQEITLRTEQVHINKITNDNISS